MTLQTLEMREQEQLVARCIAEGVPLSEALATRGLDYDALRYRVTAAKDNSLPNSITLDDVRVEPRGVPSVSFFSGSGGLDLGFEAAGFLHVGAFELMPVFCETLRTNRPMWNVFGPPDHNGDLRQRHEVAEILRVRLGISSPFEGVFHGGPPCQPFSIAANQRFAKWGDNFKRVGFDHEQHGSLLSDFAWYVSQFRPRAFLIENVPGMASIDGGAQIRAILNDLEAKGYQTTGPTLVQAAAYGVPQRRERVLVVGWRTNARFFPPRESLTPVPSYRALEKDVRGLPNHVTRVHRAESIQRYMELRYGERDHLGRVDRLNPNLPSKTVIAGGVGGGGRSHLHPDIPRTLSPRECARLQTFPDDYVFTGPAARQLTQVGNAVPPLLAARYALAIWESFFH
ncbi:MAG: DNA cytosine methyltransferase [Dehalococcoidia bacterium]|nr:DNA cytosine methyltransferase [Dehalococcoidia bacterium]